MGLKKYVFLSLQPMTYSPKIAAILIGGTLLIASSGCKHRSRESYALNAFEEAYQDTFFLNKTLISATDKCRAQLVNIA